MTAPRSSNRVTALALAGVLAIGALILFVAFSRDTNAGSLAVAATLTRGSGVTELQYQVTGPGQPPITGKAPVPDPAAPTSVAIEDLPAARGYAIEITAASGDGRIKCARKQTFDVEIGKTTSLQMDIPCRDMSAITAFLQARQAAPPNLQLAVVPPPPVEVPPQCLECEKSHIDKGECEPDSGCEGLGGEDKLLCQNLLNCMRATNCWLKDPLDCLCGTVDYVECTKGGNGVCLAEMQAATKTTDPIKNGTLFFDPTVPAGRANRLISCDKEKCRSHCTL
jgi:hypothetical protein